MTEEWFIDWLSPAAEQEFQMLIHLAADQELWFAKRCAENGLDRLLEAQMWHQQASRILTGDWEWVSDIEVSEDEDADVNWDDSMEGEEDD